MTRVLTVCVVVVAACGGKQAEQDECATTISGSLDRAKPDLKNEAAKAREVADVLDQMKAIMAKRCREDRWSKAALACLKASTDTDSAKACQSEHLTKEQHDKLLFAVATFRRPGKEAPAVTSALAKLSEFRDRMCKCTDRDCVDTVSKEMTEWGVEAAKAGPAPKLDKGETKLSARLGEEIAECTNQVIAGSGK